MYKNVIKWYCIWKRWLWNCYKRYKNGDNLIEVETVENNEKINTIEKVKKQIVEIEIPIDTTNFFVKKAEIELDKLRDR